MKKAIFILFLLLSGMALNAQITTYKITKSCSKSYDKSLGAWENWSDWTPVLSMDGVISINDIAASINGIRISQMLADRKSAVSETFTTQFKGDISSNKWVF